MFDLVIDIERYPEFVPGYLKARIVRKGDAMLLVEQNVGFGPLTTTFSSEALYDRPRHIQIRSVEKPFALLEIHWAFQPTPEGCRIAFNADGRLGAGIAARLLQPWIDSLANSVPTAFVRRARAIYGQRAGPGPR
jgi:coenzyme Q-binding protein COQ10